MSVRVELANTLTSYLEDNNIKPWSLAKEIDKVTGVSNSISYNTLYYISKGERERPTKFILLLPLLYERAEGPLKELAFNLMEILEINGAAK